MNELRRRPLVPSGAYKEHKRTYIFIQGKDGVTYRAIDDMREAMGLRGGSHIDRWEVRVNPKEMFDASRAADVPGSAVVGARQRADSLHKQVMHGIRYSTPMRIEGPTLWMSVAVDRLRKAGCDIKVYLIPPMSYEIVVFGEVFALESSSEARGFLAGLEKGFIPTPLQMPGGTKRSKRSA